MKFNTPSSVALMKTFYNFVMLPNKQRHNISESVSLILVPKSGKFQTCAGRATTLITVLPYPQISHIRCGVLFVHPHIGFSRTSEQMNGQTPHFRVFIILVQQRSRDERMEVFMNCNNVKLTNLGKSIVAKLSNYEFKDHALCINVEYVSVMDCLDRDNNILQYDCLEDCCRGSFKGAGKIRMPLDDCEDNGFMECCADFSGTFEVKNYDRESRQFTTNISVNYQKR